MTQVVIFKELGKYKMTTLENYEAQIRNANEVTVLAIVIHLQIVLQL